MARVIVNVALKPEILDPQGRAVQGALGRLGLAAESDAGEHVPDVLAVHEAARVRAAVGDLKEEVSRFTI